MTEQTKDFHVVEEEFKKTFLFYFVKPNLTAVLGTLVSTMAFCNYSRDFDLRSPLKFIASARQITILYYPLILTFAWFNILALKLPRWQG